MITVNKEEKRIDIVDENYETMLLVIDGQEYKVPLTNGTGLLSNIEAIEIQAYGISGLLEIKNI